MHINVAIDRFLSSGRVTARGMNGIYNTEMHAETASFVGSGLVSALLRGQIPLPKPRYAR